MYVCVYVHLRYTFSFVIVLAKYVLRPVPCKHQNIRATHKIVVDAS